MCMRTCYGIPKIKTKQLLVTQSVYVWLFYFETANSHYLIFRGEVFAQQMRRGPFSVVILYVFGVFLTSLNYLQYSGKLFV